MMWLISQDPESFEDILSRLPFPSTEVKYIQSFDYAMKALDKNQPDLIVIDSSSAEAQQLEIYRQLMSLNRVEKIFTIILTSKLLEQDQAVIDSRNIEQLPGRENNVTISPLVKLQISKPQTPSRIKCVLNERDALMIDADSFLVVLNTTRITLSRKEFDLLWLLASYPGKVFTRTEIFLKVWKRTGNEKDRSIDVHILRLRRKFGETSIITHKGIGYRLSTPFGQNPNA